MAEEDEHQIKKAQTTQLWWLKFIKVSQWNSTNYKFNLMQDLDKVVMAAKINNAHILYIPVPHDYCDYQ